jgi:hypothetical protein
MTLKVCAAPMRSKPIANVATGDVPSVLKPIWLSKPDTATTLRK